MLKESPFLPANEAAYQSWREEKLGHRPASTEDLLVELHDALHPTRAEIEAIQQRCRRSNMAIYACGGSVDGDGEFARLLAGRCGLQRVDNAMASEGDGMAAIQALGDEYADDYVPYTNHRLHWHTDGYYNPPGSETHALIVHCVRGAASGGENRLMDHELLYLLLRDANPGHVEALMAADAMTVPQHVEDGKVLRSAFHSPVFSVDAAHGHLHMRYTEEKRHITWKQDRATQEAIAAIERLLNAASSPVYHITLEPGMGIIANNVLHDRAAFEDIPGNGRLLYRLRYHDRVTNP